jgi:uncharacterized protein (DUF885 family)
MMSCRSNELEKAAAFAQVDLRFNTLADDYIKGFLDARPEMGTYLGFHDYDGHASEYIKAALDKELNRLKYYDKALSLFPKDSLSEDILYDYQILAAAVKQELFSFEDLNVYTTNPMTYAGAIDLNIYISRDFAPLEERVKSIISIEQTAPAIFEAARQNLADSLPKPYVETAIQIARGNADFMEHQLVEALAELSDDTLKREFLEMNKMAVSELKNFATWLEREKLKKTHNRYAIGKEKYAKMLLVNEMLTITPERVMAFGMEELKKEQEMFAKVAAKIDPTKKPIEVFAMLTKEHPTAEGLIPEARKNVESIRQFLIDKNIITVPSEVRVEIKETPQYARSTSTASMDTPGPFETKATQAYYYITPVEPTWTKKQAEEWLSLFNIYITDIVSIHEAYPGHYVQFLKLNASNASRVSKIFGSYAFVEGWAHYTEKMMIEEGFGGKDSLTQAKYHLAQINESLLRWCRWMVSVKTHCEGMTVEEGTKFFMENAYYEEKPAYQEALRGTFDPGYLSYALGKVQILKLREAYKAKEGENYSLIKFHDTLLDHGMPPLELTAKRMVGGMDWGL